MMSIFSAVKTLLGGFWKRVLQHKILSAFLAIVVIGGGYYAYGKLQSGSTETRYVLATVEKGTLVASVSGSGQVSAATQFDVKSKVSGDVVTIGVNEGQKVGAGTLLVRLDDTDARKTVRDAEDNLESAQLALEKLKQSSADIDKILEDAFADISNTFLDIPTVVSDAETIVLKDTMNPNIQANGDFYKDFIGQRDDVNFKNVSLFVDTAISDYHTARSDYDNALLSYKNTTRYSDASTIQALLEKTLKSTKSLAQALKSEQNVLDFLSDYASTNNKRLPSLITTYKSTLRTDIGLVNTHLSGLVSADNSVKNAPLDIRSQELSIKQRETALKDAKEALLNYSIYAPFSGTVAEFSIKKGDSLSSNSVVATLITAQRIAEISLNEVDAAQVKVGQKATLTFDAIDGLSITGEVSNIDAIGTVTQGVVNYSAKIVFDTQDERVKPGMSVSATIITDMKQDVLLVPNSAVKYNEEQYVQVLENNIPRNQTVETGLSNDAMTEIKSGLKEGDKVVTQTITATTKTTTSKSTGSMGGIGIPGLGGGGGTPR